MRILLLSIFALVFVGCASYPKKNGFQSVETIQKKVSNPYFSDTSKDYVYKANIDAFDKSFGGLLIVKKLGPANHRIVFTTEMGYTLFDFTLGAVDFKINRILKPMDRRLLVNLLKRDFKVLMEEHSPVLQTFRHAKDIVTKTEILSKKHYFYSTERKLLKVVRAGNGKEKVVFRFSEIEDGVAGKIRILHKTLPLAITLNRI